MFCFTVYYLGFIQWYLGCCKNSSLQKDKWYAHDFLTLSFRFYWVTFERILMFLRGHNRCHLICFQHGANKIDDLDFFKHWSYLMSHRTQLVKIFWLNFVIRVKGLHQKKLIVIFPCVWSSRDSPTHSFFFGGGHENSKFAKWTFENIDKFYEYHALLEKYSRALCIFDLTYLSGKK